LTFLLSLYIVKHSTESLLGNCCIRCLKVLLRSILGRIYMADSEAKQQSTNEPLQTCSIGHDYAGRNIFLYGLFLLCVSTTCVVLLFVDLLFLQYWFLGLLAYLIGFLSAAVSLFLLIILVWSVIFRLRHFVCLFWAIFLLLFLWRGMPKFENYIFRRQLAVTKQTILQLVSDIESLRSKTNRLPENESELVKLRGKAMPLSAWRTPLEYLYHKDPNGPSYFIKTFHPNYFSSVSYNSRYPDAGVIHDSY